MVENIHGLSLDLISHPGETLEEVLESNNMTQKELAARIDVSTKHLNQIINGLVGISNDVAFKLGNVFSLPASFWTNLQANYDQLKMGLLERESITDEERQNFSSKLYNQLCKFNYLEKQSDKDDKIIQLRKFVGLSNLANEDVLLKSTACFRKSEKVNTDFLTLIAWMKICEIETDKINVTVPYDRDKLISKLSDIKELNLCHDLNEIVNKLQVIFAECGIAFTVVRNLTGAPVQGMVRRINNKVRLCITLRNSFADIIWFTLFHEIGHLLNNDEEYHINYAESNRSGKEEMADKFAKDILLNDLDYKQFLINGCINESSIIEYSNNKGILPGILVGRLQHDGFIMNHMFNNLKTRYAWGN